MANVVLIMVFVLLAWVVFSAVRSRGSGIVSKRGTGVRADLAGLADQQRVLVADVARTSDDLVRVKLVPVPGPDDEFGPGTMPVDLAGDLEFEVRLSPEDFGYGVLLDWKERAAPVAIVTPPGTSIVRLRSVDDLQPVTLRRVTG